MDYEDIVQHITLPERIYLLESGNNGNSEVLAMGSYNRAKLSGFPSLIVEGIAVDPSKQGRGIFKEITDMARNQEAVICLRTQNPRMYRALEKYCPQVYPGQLEMPEAVRAIRDELAVHLSCKADKEGVIRGHYGRLFYGTEPTHPKTGELFKNLGVELHNGDALLVIGVK